MLRSEIAPKTYDALLMGIDMMADMSDRLGHLFRVFMSQLNLGYGLTVSEQPNYSSKMILSSSDNLTIRFLYRLMSQMAPIMA